VRPRARSPSAASRSSRATDRTGRARGCGYARGVLARAGFHHRRHRRPRFRPRGAALAAPAAPSRSAPATRRAPRRRPSAPASWCPRPRSPGSTMTRPAAASELVILSVPFRHQSETLHNLRHVLRSGQLLVDATVPLAAAVAGRATAHARRLAGLGRPAGPGDGARGRDRPQRAPHGERRGRCATSTTRSTRTSCWPATSAPTSSAPRRSSTPSTACAASTAGAWRWRASPSSSRRSSSR